MSLAASVCICYESELRHRRQSSVQLNASQFAISLKQELFSFFFKMFVIKGKNEIEEELVAAGLFYKPIRPITTYHFDETNGSIFQHLFQSPMREPIAGNSHSYENRVQSPPQEFNATRVNEDGRACQLCSRVYKNKLHQNKYRGNNICCVCRYQFDDKDAYFRHLQQTLWNGICCVCGIGLSDPETNGLHFNLHGSKKRNFISKFIRSKLSRHI